MAAHASRGSVSMSAAGDALMKSCDGGTRRYAQESGLLLGVCGQAFIGGGSLFGVIHDGTMTHDLGLADSTATLAASLLFVGWGLGAFLGGSLADEFGRKPLIGVSHVAAAIAFWGLAVAPASSAAMFIASKSLLGLACGIYNSPGYTLLLESVSDENKGDAAATWSFGYVVGVALLGGVHAVSGGAWRTEAFIWLAITVLAALISQLRLVESPRWLLADCGGAEATEAASIIAQRNNMADAQLVIIEGTLNDVDVFGPSELLSAQFLATTAATALFQASWNAAYYGLAMSAGSFSDDVSLNLVLLAAVDIPGANAALAVIPKTGSKIAVALSLALTAVALVALSAAPQFAQPIALAGKAACAGAFASVFLFTTEAFPTKLASAALGFGTTAGKAGAAVAPPLLGLPGTMEFLVMSATLVVAAGAAIALPEDHES